jgi:lipid-binding SYLF domain-containing protein
MNRWFGSESPASAARNVELPSDEAEKGTTMPGMVHRAERVLEQATSAGIRGIPSRLLRDCYGLVLLSGVSTSFLLSGSLATGIVLAKADPPSSSVPTERLSCPTASSKAETANPSRVPDNDDTVEWTYPCACVVSGKGWGLSVGVVYQDIMIFLMEPSALQFYGNRLGVSIGGHVGITLGVGRNLGVSLGRKGGNVSIAWTKGAAAGVSVDGGVVGVRPQVNADFYQRPGITAQQILLEHHRNNLILPASQAHVLDRLYEKLHALVRQSQREEGAFAPAPDPAEAQAIQDAIQEKGGLRQASTQDDQMERQARKVKVSNCLQEYDTDQNASAQ